MKWLATFLCLLATSPAIAEEPENNIVNLPFYMTCGEKTMEGFLNGKYGELPMLEGDAQVIAGPNRFVPGKMTMFVNPETKTYTVVFVVAGQMHCMITSGENLAPAPAGDPI